jgi:hypothetical protein
MPKLLTFDSPNGQVHIAVRTAEDTIAAVSVVDDAIEMAEKSLDEALAIVTKISDSVFSALSKSQHAPSSTEVEFGLQFTAKGTIYVVEAQAEASLNVKLTYNQ